MGLLAGGAPADDVEQDQIDKWHIAEIEPRVPRQLGMLAVLLKLIDVAEDDDASEDAQVRNTECFEKTLLCANSLNAIKIRLP